MSDNCPICQKDVERKLSRDLNHYFCHRCGEFIVPFPSHREFESLTPDQRLCISITNREAKAHRKARGVLNSDRDPREFDHVAHFFGLRPATELAYSWLWDDLEAVGQLG